MKQHGVRPQGLNDMIDESRFAVDSGYWPLYRYNPELIKEGKNPFVLDSKKLRKDVAAFLQRESRFLNLKKNYPEIAGELFAKMNNEIICGNSPMDTRRSTTLTTLPSRFCMRPKRALPRELPVTLGM
jgi:hypothetical protein